MRPWRALAATCTTATSVLFAAGSADVGQAATPSAFTARIDNPYLPMLRGMRWEYRGVKGAVAGCARSRV